MFNALLAGKAQWPLLLTGGTGNGKTCAALCLIDAVGGGCLYYTLGRLITDRLSASKGQLRDNYGRVVSVSAFMYNWENATLTVLDELGTKAVTHDWEFELLLQAIDAREGQRSVYITNKTLEELAALYDQRIASRLGRGTAVKIPDGDRRMGESKAAGMTT